jgi:hypothetical protein
MAAAEVQVTEFVAVALAYTRRFAVAWHWQIGAFGHAVINVTVQPVAKAPAL